MTEDETELGRFAELLMRLVRDQAIRTCDLFAAGRMGGPDGARWKETLSLGPATEPARAAVRELVPDIVDQVLFELLNAIDQGDLPLAWKRRDGSTIELYDLGTSEMAGWFMASDAEGWRARHSTQRFFAPDVPDS